MSHILRTALATTLLLGAVGCAGDEAGSPDDAIGPRGGTVVSDDGRLTLDVPDGALSGDVVVSIATVNDGPHDAIGPTYELLPTGTAFKIPATLTYDIDDLDMKGFHRESAALVVEKGDTWFYLADQDKDDGYITATTVYLSKFTVIGDRDDPGEGPGEDDDS